MKKIHFVMYVCDNELLLLNITKNKVIEQTFKSLKEDQITNKNMFYNEFNDFLNKNHIKIPLFGWNLCFIKNELITEVQLETFQEVLNDYFKKIEIKNIEDIVKLNKDTSFMNITNNYIDYYYMKKNKSKLLRVNLQIFNNNIGKVINHLLTNFYKPRKIIVFGNHSNIPTMVEYINKNFNVPATFSEFYKSYLLEEYKK